MIVDKRISQLESTVFELQQKILGYQMYIKHLENSSSVVQMDMKDISKMFSSSAVMTGIGNNWDQYEFVEDD